MKIREAKLSDAESLKNLMAQLGSEYEMTTVTMEARIKAFNKKHDHKIFVVAQDAQILGIMGIACYEQLRLPGKCCHLDTLIIDKNFRGKGIGKMLMEKLENFVKENNCLNIELISANHRRISGTHDFYKTLGFKDHDELDYTFFSKFFHSKTNVSDNGVNLKPLGGPVRRELKKTTFASQNIDGNTNHIKAKL